MDSAIAVRALDVLGVVLWIGGVAFVTTALLVGATGFHLTAAWDLRDRCSCTDGSSSARGAQRRERSAGSSGCTGCCQP
jgi:hypothetical protein